MQDDFAAADAVAAGSLRERIGLCPAQMEIADAALRLWLDLPQAIA